MAALRARSGPATWEHADQPWRLKGQLVATRRGPGARSSGGRGGGVARAVRSDAPGTGPSALASERGQLTRMALDGQRKGRVCGWGDAVWADHLRGHSTEASQRVPWEPQRLGGVCSASCRDPGRPPGNSRRGRTGVHSVGCRWGSGHCDTCPVWGRGRGGRLSPSARWVTTHAAEPRGYREAGPAGSIGVGAEGRPAAGRTRGALLVTAGGLGLCGGCPPAAC